MGSKKVGKGSKETDGKKENFLILLRYISLHSKGLTKAFTESKLNLTDILGGIWFMAGNLTSLQLYLRYEQQLCLPVTASHVLCSSHSLVVQERNGGFIYIFVAIDVIYLYAIHFSLQETLHPQLKYLPKFVSTRESCGSSSWTQPSNT